MRWPTPMSSFRRSHRWGPTAAWGSFLRKEYMMDDHRSAVPALDELRELLADSKYAAAATDPQRHHARLYKMLSEHKNPIWREIGEQLRDGKMRLDQVLGAEAYREVFFTGLRENRETFVDSLRAAKGHLAVTKASDVDGGESVSRRG